MDQTNPLTVSEQAQQTLKLFKPYSHIAGIETEPVLTKEGGIQNLTVFHKLAAEAINPASCDTPVEKLAANAPRVVYKILKAIEQMDASYDEKRLLFDEYVKGNEFQGNREPFNAAYVAFMEAYEQL